MATLWTLSEITRQSKYITLLWVVFVLLALQDFPSLAQRATNITPTTGAGNLNTNVTRIDSVYEITGGTRPQGGPNLFHSFGEFGVPPSNIANFLNEAALPTSNILGRVTGGNPSNIFGTIQTTGFGSANLFLMNPAGIVFGPNASLNVGGSVTFTTADYLRFADSAKFNAIPGPQDASISSAPVAAFGFLGSNPAAITVQGSKLSVTSGQSIALVGGDLTVEGATLSPTSTQPAQLLAPGGEIYLASAKSPGEFEAGTLGQAPNTNGQSFSTLGTTQVSQKSIIDTSGNGGGTVVIRGGRLLLNDSQIAASVTGPPIGPPANKPGGRIDIQVAQDVVIENKAFLSTNVLEDAQSGIASGGVHVQADRIEIRGITSGPRGFTGIESFVEADSMGGKSGDIRLNANSILLKDNGEIITFTESKGDAGHIFVNATEELKLDRGRVSSFSEFSSGNTGNIALTAQHGDVLMINSPFVTIQTFAGGNAKTGKINVTAEGNVLLADRGQLFTATRGTGGAGAIEITANDLTLLNRSGISDDNLGPTQPGGITVALSGNLALRDGSQIAPVSRSLTGAPAADFNITAKDILITGSGSRLSSETFRAGQGGILNISAETLQLTNGGQIRSGSTIQPVPPAPRREIPTGAGGTINIQGTASPARSILIDGPGSGIFTDTQGTGTGGNINAAAQSVTVQNGGTISAKTSGTAPSAAGGNIAISGGQSVTLTSGGSITANGTGPADAGNIAINAGAQFLSQNGSITTEASQASGGNIFIQATDAIRLMNSRLSTSVQGGPTTSGGNITLDPAVVTLQNSQVLAQAVQGAGGNINIIAGTFLTDQSSVVSASSQFGLSGSVNIQSPVSSLSGSLATLPQRPLQVQHLLQQRCAAQANGQLSSLVVAGRDTLPSEPGGWLPSSLALLSEEVADRAPHQQQMIVSGPLDEQSAPSPQQALTSWTASCGS